MKFLDLPEKALSEINNIIIVTKDKTLGILTDAITGMRSISLQDIQPSLPTLTGIRAEYLKGVTSERLVVLDALKILSSRSITVHEEV